MYSYAQVLEQEGALDISMGVVVVVVVVVVVYRLPHGSRLFLCERASLEAQADLLVHLGVLEHAPIDARTLTGRDLGLGVLVNAFLEAGCLHPTR